MAKKPIVIGSIILGLILLTLIVQNQQLKSEKEKLKEDKNDLQIELKEQDQKTNTKSIFSEAGNAAEHFIETYFQFTNQPIKEDVQPLVTKEVLDKLSFQDEIETDENLSNVNTKVSDLEIYYGRNTDDRQEVFARFNSRMEIDGKETYSPSFIKLDMIKDNSSWKVDKMDFTQY